MAVLFALLWLIVTTLENVSAATIVKEYNGLLVPKDMCVRANWKSIMIAPTTNE